MFEPTVELVNRVRDANGKPVPWRGMFGGEQVWIVDRLHVPQGAARILIHQSMYKVEPDTSHAEYRLGCEALGVPTDLIPFAETQREELLDRDLLTPDRQLGTKDRGGRTLTVVKRPYRPSRRDPLTVNNPGQDSGAFSGAFERP